MKMKCSYILKASTALVLALLMLFGTMAGSVAAVVENGGFAASDSSEDAAPADTDDEEAEEDVQPEAASPAADVPAYAPGFSDVLRDKADLADTGANKDLAGTGWWGGDYYVYNNITTNGWSTGSPQCSVDSGHNYYYIFYMKYADGTSGQLRYRYYSSTGGKTVAPDTTNYNTDSNHSNVHDYSSTDNYYYHTMTNNTKWNRVLVGFDINGNSGAGYVWSSKTELTDLAATCTAASTTINEGASVKLTGSCSGDFSTSYYDGGVGGKKAVYTYQYSTDNSNWTDIGSKVNVTGSGAGTDSTGVTFTPSADGTYYVRVIVNDGNVVGGTNAKADRYATSSAVTITVRNKNTITYNKGTAKTGGGTISPATTPATQYYYNGGSAITLATNYYSSSGYEQDGWATSDKGSKVYNSGASYSTNADKNLYPAWVEKTSTFTVQAGSNGSITKGAETKSGVATYVSVTAVTPDTNYVFDGWTVSGTDASHVRVKNTSGTVIFNGTSWTSTANQKLTSIRVYSDGTNKNMTATVQANFIDSRRTYYVGKMVKDDAGNYTTAKASAASNTGDGYNATATVGGNSTSATVNIGSTAALVTTGNINGTDTQNTVDSSFNYVKYKFVGWKSYNSAQTSVTGSNSTWDSTSASYSPTVTASSNQYWYACYVKQYIFCAYDSYDHALGAQNIIRQIAAPPNQYSVNGGSTYTSYSPEGHKIAVPAGSSVVLKYSALASSDCIDHVYYDNSTDYTDATPTAANFTGDDLPEISPVTVDNSAHTVTFTMTQHWKNITIATGTKFRVFFSESDNIEVQSKNVDNFYTPGENMSGSSSATYFTVKAAGNANLTNYFSSTSGTHNGISYPGIKYYYCDGNGNFTDASGNAVSTPVEITSNTITIASGTTSYNTGATPGSAIRFGGTMPSTNVYIDLGLKQEVTVQHGSKMVSDTSTNAYVAWAKVAEIRVQANGNASTSAQSVSGSDPAVGTLNNGYDSSAVVAGCAKTVAVGQYITYVWDYWKPAASNNNQTFSDSYMFVGWYKGDTTGPDYAHGFISDKEYLKYSPKENTVIWAVGTRDMYINGSANITGTTAWPTNNIKMEFDADYVNPDGGARGRYKYTITQTIFNTTGSTPSYTKGTLGGTSDGGTYFTNGGDTGNSYFKFYDAKTQSNDNLGTWSGIDTYYNQTSTNGLKFGKASYYNDKDNETNRKIYGQGFIEFSEADFQGYAAPLYIYYYPGKGFSVEASFIYIDIYLSNGYAVGGTSRDTNTSHTGNYASTLYQWTNNAESTTNIEGPIGSGWTPDNEGHVAHYKVKEKDATVRVKKTCASTEKVSAFFVYDLYSNSVHAVRDVKNSSNTYYADIKMIMGHNLYIVPIIEVKDTEANPNMTVYFDATQLNTDRWGKIVTCYAWYSNGSTNKDALGAFPGQPMIPSDDGNSWTASFPKSITSGGSTYTLAGITFSNYIDGNHSWVGMNMDGVTYTNEGADNQTYTLDGTGKVHLYNAIGGTDKTKKYEKVNCKVQTYDYRDPIAYYQDAVYEGTTADITLTFAIKMGNSDDLMSAKHSELKNGTAAHGNIFTGITHTHSDGSTVNNELKFLAGKNFEYLTNAKGNLYVDMNGNEIKDTNGNPLKETATYYVLAKGQVVYKNGSLTQVFWSGSRNESSSSLAYYNTNLGSGTNAQSSKVNEVYPLTGTGISRSDITGVSENYGVEWYIYDASGNYITNVLAAGFADNATDSSTNNDSIIGAKLRSMGYAVDNKAVAICYDKPRALNTDDENGGTKYINSGTGFDAYRATGQWYKTTKLQPVTISARVGIMTDSGEVLSESNSDGYGTATAMYDTNKGSANGSIRGVAAPLPLGAEYPDVTTAIKDAENTPVRLTASEDNFQGWYYYDEGTGKFTKAKYDSNEDFYPNYTKDMTFYAMYKASALYRYGYMGREGQRYYTVSGGSLSGAEMKAGNAPATTRTNVTGDGGLAPVDKMTVFKQTLDFSKNASDNTYSASDYSNTRAEYYLDIANCKKTAETYTVTAYYKNASGNLTSSTASAVYNGQALDLTSGGTPLGNLYTAKQFVGWYAYDGGTVGELLSTNRNFGMRLTRDQAIIACYVGDGNNKTLPTAADTWHAYIDENLVTREMYSSDSGMFYNDTIVRVRNDQGVLTALPSGAEVGIIMISDNKSGDTTTRTEDQLTAYANALSNGQSGKINNTNLSATKASTTNVTKFNRADLAIRGDYAKMKDCDYSVYAYIKLSNGTYSWSSVKTVGNDTTHGYPEVPADE